MKNLRVPMIVLAALHLAFACLTAMVGLFADGGTIPERILLSLIHPIAAILLLIVVASSGGLAGRLRGITLALLSVNVVGDVVAAVLIGTGVIKGDWSLPLVFAIVPLIGLIYLAAPGPKTA